MSETPQESVKEPAGQPPDHPRFAKPQRVAFVQSAWHPEVVEAGRLAFLAGRMPKKLYASASSPLAGVVR